MLWLTAYQCCSLASCPCVNSQNAACSCETLGATPPRRELDFMIWKNVKANWVLALLMLQIPSCLRHSSISLEQASRICTQELPQIYSGKELSRASTRIYPHPVTLDSISHDKISIPWMNFEEWRKQVGPSLANKTFWKCTCVPEGLYLDGINEIYVDARSGEILYVYPLWNR